MPRTPRCELGCFEEREGWHGKGLVRWVKRNLRERFNASGDQEQSPVAGS